MKKITLGTILLLLIVITVPQEIYTQEAPPEGIGKVSPPPNIPKSPDAISRYIPTIINISFLIGVIATLVYIVYGGVRWIMSGGDQKALNAARETIIQAIIGFILLTLAFSVAKIFEKFLGIN